MVRRSPVPVAVYQAPRMLSLVSAPLSFLLLPRIRHASSGFAKIPVDLVVRNVVAAPSEFVEEQSGAQTRLFPGLLDHRLLISTQVRFRSSLWIQSRNHPRLAMHRDQLLHTALRYSVDLRRFLHGEKAGTYTAYEPFDLSFVSFTMPFEGMVWRNNSCTLQSTEIGERYLLWRDQSNRREKDAER